MKILMSIYNWFYLLIILLKNFYVIVIVIALYKLYFVEVISFMIMN